MDFSTDYQIAAVILFPLALAGFLFNLTVVAFLRVVPSLNNSFGSLTLSQAVSDSIHQFIFAFYLAPCMFIHDEGFYSISQQFGFTLITVYNICGMAHVCISANRFLAVYAPFLYTTIFNQRNTRILIVVYWTIGIAASIYLLKMIDCYNYLPQGQWGFEFKNTPTCMTVLWYVEFVRYIVYVAIVAVLDFFSILKIHYINIRFKNTTQTTASTERQRRERNLVYQAALQGIFFFLELITYFILSPYARNKWEHFFLTTVSWCLVHGMDGFIVLTCNRDFRRQIQKCTLCGTFQVGPSVHMQIEAMHNTASAGSSHASLRRYSTPANR